MIARDCWLEGFDGEDKGILRERVKKSSFLNSPLVLKMVEKAKLIGFVKEFKLV